MAEMDLWSFFAGKDAKLKTQQVVDPLKKAVATPLSSYLTSQIGQGVPRYTEALAVPTASAEDPGLAYGGGSSLSDFLSLDSNSFFNKNVQDTTMENWKRNVAPVIQEGWAGALSGSGRYSELTASGADLSGTLAKQRGEFALALPAAQYETTSKMRQQTYDINANKLAVETAQENERLKLEYTDWMKSLPQYNPSLGNALTFLNNTTSSGTDTLSYIDPGMTGLWGSVLSLIGGLFGSGNINMNSGNATNTKTGTSSGTGTSTSAK